MNGLSLMLLAASVAVATLAHQLVVRAIKTVQLAASPLSGEHMDSFVYERTLFTPGETDMLWTWAALLAAGAGWWGYAEGLPEARWFGLGGMLA